MEIASLVKEAYFVPETMFIDDLLKNMQKTRNQIAILMDEYGGVAGLITIEDMLEEIVGDIDDEYDDLTNEFTKINEHTYDLDGMLALDDFNRMFQVELPSRGVDTIAGFVLTLLGNIPEDGETAVAEYDDFIFTALEIKDARLVSIRAERKPAPDAEPVQLELA